MATYAIRILKNGTAQPGLEVAFVGERKYGTTDANGVVSANLGTYASPLAVGIVVKGQQGGACYWIEPNSTLDISV